MDGTQAWDFCPRRAPVSEEKRVQVGFILLDK